MSWEKVISFSELEQKKRFSFKKASKQIAIFKLGEKIFAVDNRCPHQGYPLVEGSLDSDQTLVCHWHNWKFDIQTGKCKSGGDPVRTYPIKEEGGFVWLNLSTPSKEEIEKEILQGFREGFQKNKLGRITRELAKLHFYGLDPLVAIREAVKLACERMSFEHALSVVSDWLEIYSDNPKNFENQLICLMEISDYLAEEGLSKKPLSFNSSERKKFRELEWSLTQKTLDGYYDLGHAVIHLYRIGRLIDFLGNSLGPDLLCSFEDYLSHAKREDLLPEFQDFSHYLKLYPRKKRIKKKIKKLNADWLIGKTSTEAMKWVAQQAKDYSAHELYECLVEINARTLLSFDLSFQISFSRPVSQNVEFKDVAHGLLFAHAVKKQCEKFPELWPQGLLQLACFSGRFQAFRDRSVQLKTWEVKNQKKFMQEIQNKVLDHGLGSFVQSTHWVQTYVAVKEMLKDALPQTSRYLLAALNRYLHSPMKEKHLRRKARQNILLISKDF